MEKTVFPKAFQENLSQILGEERSIFFETLQKGNAPTSIRSNPHKSQQLLFPEFASSPVDWYPSAAWLSERPIFTLDPAFHAGAYYVQEAASMLIGLAVLQILEGRKKPICALDMCAAPGGKSTLLLDVLPEGSLLVANEIIRSRNIVLRENLEKWGLPNTAVFGENAENWAHANAFFDLILVDAPCSGEGLFRRDPKAISEWSPAHVEFCASRQKSILAPLVVALKTGGFLLYSTCTYNSTENESNIEWLLVEFPLERTPLKLNPAWGFVQNQSGIHSYPHKVQGEGFFLSVLRKKGEVNLGKEKTPKRFSKINPISKKQVALLKPWIKSPDKFAFFETPNQDVLALPESNLDDFLRLDAFPYKKHFGTVLGQFKGKDFVPDHALALSVFSNENLQCVDLPLDLTLAFLKKENIALPTGTKIKGWALATYQNLPLGWMKCLPNRVNNYLPKNRRILMDIPKG